MKLALAVGALGCLVTGGAYAAAGFDQSLEAPAPDKTALGTWGFDTAGMDRSVKPGDNFNRFANGAWIRATKVPSDRAQWDSFARLDDLSNRRTRQILQEASRQPGSKIGDFYASFMDRATVDARGHEPIKPIFARIDAVTTQAQLGALLGDLARMNINTPFSAWAEADDRNPDQAIANLYQAGLGMPERQYYLSDDAIIAPKRKAYGEHLAKLLALIGEPDAQARADAVLQFERKLADAHWPQVDTRDPEKNYNRLSPGDLRKAAPAFDWDGYIAAVGFAGQPYINVRQPSAITGLATVVATSPLLLVKDYLKLRALDAYAPYLSQRFVDANFAFHGTILGGLVDNPPLEERAATLVSTAMGEEIGKVYVQRYFPPAAKAEADRLVANVIQAWDRRIQNLSWMSPETKTRARAKLAALVPEIGYPVRWRDYSSLAVRRDDLFGNAERGNRFEHQRLVDQLGKPIDKRQWYAQLPPMGVNGYANHKSNQIVFSAGILQPPFFDPNADPAINYGGMATVIAHEIGHHFDDQGSKYDENGALNEWWTPADRQRFEALTDNLVAQYDKYEVLPGKFVNGRLTVGDNIGDLAGVTVAYDAYKASEEGRSARVIGGFTGDQRFFLGWAQTWRGVMRREELEQRLLTDVHAPPEQRVWVVRNVDGWYDAFGVKPGDKLYLSPSERVRVW